MHTYNSLELAPSLFVNRIMLLSFFLPSFSRSGLVATHAFTLTYNNSLTQLCTFPHARTYICLILFVLLFTRPVVGNDRREEEKLQRREDKIFLSLLRTDIPVATADTPQLRPDPGESLPSVFQRLTDHRL